MNKLLNYAEIAKDFVQTSVESTVNAVEQIHLSVADTAFTVLASKSGQPETLAIVQNRHREAAQGIYNGIRQVNRTLGELATDAFEALENSELAARAKQRQHQD